jgi:hypothetical protein
VNLFIDIMSDAGTQMTTTLAYVARAFGADWRSGLGALFERPTALFYLGRSWPSSSLHWAASVETAGLDTNVGDS